MSGIIHTHETLSEIIQDLGEMSKRLSEMLVKMESRGIEAIQIDGHVGQLKGRAAIAAFVANGEVKLRILQTRKESDDRQTAPKNARRISKK